jgi:hypothetical protein
LFPSEDQVRFGRLEPGSSNLRRTRLASRTASNGIAWVNKNGYSIKNR